MTDNPCPHCSGKGCVPRSEQNTYAVICPVCKSSGRRSDIGIVVHDLYTKVIGYTEQEFLAHSLEMPTPLDANLIDLCIPKLRPRELGIAVKHIAGGDWESRTINWILSTPLQKAQAILKSIKS